MEDFIHINHQDADGDAELHINPDSIAYLFFAAADKEANKEAQLTIMFNGAKPLIIGGENAEKIYAIVNPPKKKSNFAAVATNFR